MKHTSFIIGILIFFGLTLLTTGLLNKLFFGLFWVFILATLVSLIITKRWFATDWLVFATFAASTIIGVLYAAKAFTDLVAISIPLLGLLIVCIFVSLLANPKKRRKRQKKNKVIFVASKTGEKYHHPNCRLIKSSKLNMYKSRAAAQGAGLTPCQICLA